MLQIPGLGIANPTLLIAGLALFVFGLWLMRRAGRHDLKGAALESAWEVARGRRSAENPTAIEQKLKGITSAPTSVGKAQRAATTVLGHFVAQVLGIVGLVALLCGAGLALAGIFWR